MYFLDTDICIELIRRKPPAMIRRLQHHRPGDVAVSAVTAAELLFGAAKSSMPEKNRQALEMFLVPLDIAPFDAAAAVSYGVVRADLERAGEVIGPMDLLIAAHARSIGAILVTNNVREFSRVADLRIENWLAPSSRPSKQ